MEDKSTLFEPLFERAQAYGKTSFELYKLKTVGKASGVSSTLASRLIAFFVLSLFVLMASIGAAFWLGEILGKPYYGFFIVAGFYGIAGSILYFFMHNWVKKGINNSIIKEMLN